MNFKCPFQHKPFCHSMIHNQSILSLGGENWGGGMAETSETRGGTEKINRDLLFTGSPSAGTGRCKTKQGERQSTLEKRRYLHTGKEAVKFSPAAVVERKVYMSLKSHRTN